MTWVHGEPLDYSSISRGDHAADILAGFFLRALHVEEPAEAPTMSDRGAHPKKCTDGFEKFLQGIAPGGIAADVRAVWDNAVAAPEWEGPPVWLHGDLHPANVVVSDGTLSGVTDFDAMSAGDPAWDLAAAWVLLPSGATSRFFDVYAHADEATIQRARELAVMKSLFLILMGQAGDRGLPGSKPTWGPQAGQRSIAFWQRDVATEHRSQALLAKMNRPHCPPQASCSGLLPQCASRRSGNRCHGS